MKENKQGISLIVLVITILVIIVLAGAVILTVSQNNPLESANEAVYKGDLKNFQTELNLKVVDEIGKNGDANNINAEGDNLENLISSIKGKKRYKEILEVYKGKLYIKETSTVDEIKWAEEIGIEKKPVTEPEYGADKPYIPGGFTHTEGTVDTGFVIKDTTLGNEFVWIPVANIADFKLTDFNKGVTMGTETVPAEIIASVTKYGGYYIARYEAGTTIATADKASRNVAGIPVSKQGQMVWNYIDWNNSLANAKAMYNNSEIASDLIYGTMWDTACNWLVNSGNKTQAELLDSSNWGNYLNNTATGHGILQKTGFSEEWKANNIYDLARKCF